MAERPIHLQHSTPVRCRPSERRADIVSALILMLAAFALYAATAVPGPFDGDYGEFQYMPRVLGLPHPTGYPLYLLLGWLWSWLPFDSLAFRMNLFSAVWGAVTLGLVFAIARNMGLKRSAALAGAAVLALVPAYWEYSGLAAVYTLHTALLAAAILLWLRWSKASGRSAVWHLWAAAFTTGLALTNHPTSAFLVPAVLVFVLAHTLPRLRVWAQPPTTDQERRSRKRRLLSGVRAWLGAAVCFALPALLYLYVPLRLWAIGPGIQRSGLQESIAKGWIAPYVFGRSGKVLEYIMGRSLLGPYQPKFSTLWTALPENLLAQVGWPFLIVGLVGAVVLLVLKPRSWLLLSVLFVLAGANAVSYTVGFAVNNEIAHLQGHMLPAIMVFALWIAQGISSCIEAGQGLLRRARLVEGAALLLLVLLFVAQFWQAQVPTAADRAQSLAIRRYWTEVLAYPIEPEAALVGHWGDLTAFWYFQHGEGLRPDLWAMYPPTPAQIDAWLGGSANALYLAGPLLDWTAALTDHYTLVPWGILVRITQQGDPPPFPEVKERTEGFGDRLRLLGYSVQPGGEGRWQIWLSWATIAPTSRDLLVSIRLHAADGSLLFQQDGRLASPWYPRATIPAGQRVLTVSDLMLHDPLPPDSTLRIVVYDPATLQPLLTSAGKDIFEVGPWQPGPEGSLPAPRDRSRSRAYLPVILAP